MKQTSLVIMAAGIGSRFGGGIKQLEPVGPGGEIIMDYSIHDALEAGFNDIIFIIRKDLEKDFKEIIGKRIEKIAPVSYAFQELSDLPEGYSVPEGRKKPWGTGQAVLSAKGLIKHPFLVINADDYYGKEAFRTIHDYLVDVMDTEREGEPYDICMAGFILANTLSENGGVTRGVCQVGQDGILKSVTETYQIEKKGEELSAFDKEGNPVFDRTFNYQYTGFDIDGGLVLLYNDSSCKVFNMTGTEKYNGTFDFTVNKVSAGRFPGTLLVMGPQMMMEIKLQ